MQELIKVTRKFYRGLYPHADDDLIAQHVEKFITKCIVLELDVNEMIATLS